MKNFIYILSTIALLLLPSCYESHFVDDNLMVPELKTYPASTFRNTVTLYGESNRQSPILFFEVCLDKEFNEDNTKIFYASYQSDSIPNIYVQINSLLEPGNHYFRLCAKANEESTKIVAGNIETFSYSNPLETLSPIDVTETSAFLQGKIDESVFYSGSLYFEVSETSDFEDCQKFRNLSSNAEGNNKVYYVDTKKVLRPSTKYYVRLCSDYKGTFSQEVVSVKGNIVEFETKEGALLNIQNVKCPNSNYKLSAYVVTKGTVDYQIAPLVYDKTTDAYNLQQNVVLLPQKEYDVYILNSVGGGLSYIRVSDDNIYAEFVDNGGWRIFYAHANADLNHPSISLPVQEMTCEVKMTFNSVESGNVPINFKSEGSYLPSGYLNLVTGIWGKSSYWSSMIFLNGGKLLMLPFNVPSTGDVVITVNSRNGYKEYNMSPVNMEPGRAYEFIDGKLVKDNEELNINDVTVNPWTPNESGSITINP